MSIIENVYLSTHLKQQQQKRSYSLHFPSTCYLHFRLFNEKDPDHIFKKE